MIEVELENSPTHTLRRHLNCLDQEDPKLIEAMKEHYIRKVNLYTEILKLRITFQLLLTLAKFRNLREGPEIGVLFG